MKPPVAWRRRQERERQRSADRNEPHVLQRLLRRRHDGVRVDAALARYAKGEAVEVQGMLERRGVDHAEVDRVILRKCQSLVIWPCFPIERERRLEISALWLVKPFRNKPAT